MADTFPIRNVDEFRKNPDPHGELVKVFGNRGRERTLGTPQNTQVFPNQPAVVSTRLPGGSNE